MPVERDLVFAVAAVALGPLPVQKIGRPYADTLSLLRFNRRLLATSASFLLSILWPTHAS